MIYSNNNGNHHAFLNSIHGALFFGVPSQGMAIESLIPMVRDQPNEELLKSLGPESKLLGKQSKDFKSAFDQRPQIAYFFECQESPTARHVSLKLSCCFGSPLTSNPRTGRSGTWMGNKSCSLAKVLQLMAGAGFTGSPVAMLLTKTTRILSSSSQMMNNIQEC
jgi:hypothetical protein